ncbi:MAG: sterol desaturase/sphingolipid hydroxylase (fatty acid hydroxylase superfamily) [Flavobacteriales bacterium]|jgi:sterol desaturase/sphingolipid hydroxylase (fatty acid hydroxylase superfamily)
MYFFINWNLTNNMLADLSAPLIEDENMIRLGFFAGVLIVILLLELFLPRRQLSLPRRLRWTNNLGLILTDALLVRLLTPFSLLWFASYIEAQGWGLFNQFVMPFWIVLGISIVLLDFGIYLQHRIFHIIPVLWKLHRVHHTDLDFDVTTGLRFHPIEILISIAIKMAMILLIGAPVLAILMFEILLNGMAMFNHANLKLPLPLDHILRWLIVTPDMHRIHHSVKPKEFNSNFGFNLSCWDRLCRSYNIEPDNGHDVMQLGQSNFRSRREIRLDRMLLQPFSRPSSHPIK